MTQKSLSIKYSPIVIQDLYVVKQLEEIKRRNQQRKLKELSENKSQEVAVSQETKHLLSKAKQ